MYPSPHFARPWPWVMRIISLPSSVRSAFDALPPTYCIAWNRGSVEHKVHLSYVSIGGVAVRVQQCYLRTIKTVRETVLLWRHWMCSEPRARARDDSPAAAASARVLPISFNVSMSSVSLRSPVVVTESKATCAVHAISSWVRLGFWTLISPPSPLRPRRQPSSLKIGDFVISTLRGYNASKT